MKIKKVLANAILTLMTMLTLSSSAAEEIVRIGVITDLSGPAAYLGEQTRVGVLLAEKEINKSGQKLRVFIEDSGMNSAKAVSAAQKLVFADGVDALYVHLTPLGLAVSPFLAKRKIVSIAAVGTDSIVQNNPYIFKTLLDHRDGCKAVAHAFQSRKKEKVGFLKANADYGELCLQGAKNVYAKLNVHDFNPGEGLAIQTIRLKQEKVSAIMTCAFESDLMELLKTMNRLHFQVPISAVHDAFTEKFLSTYGSNLEGSIAYGLKPLPDTLIEGAITVNRGKQLPSYDHAGPAWLHIKHLYEAVQSCNSSLSCQMETIGKAPANPEVGFLGWEERIGRFETQLFEMQEGKFKRIPGA